MKMLVDGPFTSYGLRYLRHSSRPAKVATEHNKASLKKTCLTLLPYDTLCRILKELSYLDLVRVGRTCKRFQAALHLQALDSHLFRSSTVPSTFPVIWELHPLLQQLCCRMTKQHPFFSEAFTSRPHFLNSNERSIPAEFDSEFYPDGQGENDVYSVFTRTCSFEPPFEHRVFGENATKPALHELRVERSPTQGAYHLANENMEPLSVRQVLEALQDVLLNRLLADTLLLLIGRERSAKYYRTGWEGVSLLQQNHERLMRGGPNLEQYTVLESWVVVQATNVLSVGFTDVGVASQSLSD